MGAVLVSLWELRDPLPLQIESRALIIYMQSLTALKRANWTAFSSQHESKFETAFQNCGNHTAGTESLSKLHPQHYASTLIIPYASVLGGMEDCFRSQ
jgi:hypothetical protein